MLGEVLVHLQHVAVWQDLAQLLVRMDLALVLGILEVVRLDVHPDGLHYLQMHYKMVFSATQRYHHIEKLACARYTQALKAGTARVPRFLTQRECCQVSDVCDSQRSVILRGVSDEGGHLCAWHALHSQEILQLG